MRAIALSLLLLAACGKNDQPPPPTSGSPFAKAESGPPGAAGPHAPMSKADGLRKAQAMFGSVCITCHGVNGKGDGVAAASLDPKPRDYSNAAWQSSVTDAQIREVILKGGAGVGKSPMMPAQPQLADEPATLDGLVTIIRGFAAK